MKHMVDRYNIYFAYRPSKIDKNIHASAINFVIVSVILLQVSVMFFTILRAGKYRLVGTQLGGGGDILWGMLYAIFMVLLMWFAGA